MTNQREGCWRVSVQRKRCLAVGFGLLAAFLSQGFLLLLAQNDGKWAWVLTKSGVIAVNADQGNVVARFGTDTSSDVTVSPDGSRLYIGGNSLATVDAHTGNVLAAVPNPDHQPWPGPIPTSLMVTSLDGNHLYMLKRRTASGRDSSWIVSFDTLKQTFDESPLSIGEDCPSAFLKVRSMTQLDVVCGGYNKIFVVKLAANGRIEGASTMSLPAPAGVLPTREAHAKGDIRAAAWGRGHDVFLIKIDGRVVKVDTERKTVVGTSSEPPKDALVLSGEGALSADAKSLFFGYSNNSNRSGLKEYIAEFDAQSLMLVRTVQVNHAFQNLAWNPYRPELLLAVPGNQTLVGIAPETLQQDRLMPLGGTPALIRFAQAQ